MADDLSNLIRRVVKRGNMSHLSLFSDGIVFKAAWRGVGDRDHSLAESPDPVDALMRALKADKPRARPPAANKGKGFGDVLG